MTRFPLPLRRALARVLVTFAALAALAGRAPAQPVVGFTEDFPGTTTSSWGGGSLFSNPGTGGFGGAGDGFLQLENLSLGNLGTVSFGPEYAGDWTGAGITQVRCWLRDISGNGDLEIHLSVSDGTNTWQQNAGLVPGSGAWSLYVVDLVESDFTHIRGIGGTFAGVLTAVDRLHFRHDVSPYGPSPDPIVGTFGLDHIQLTNGSTGVGSGGAVARPVLLAPPYPNPSLGRVTFQIQQPDAHPVTLTLFDAAGRRVKQVEFAALGAAPRLWMWDGTTDDGARAPAGVYRAIARGVHGGMARTVTLLR